MTVEDVPSAEGVATLVEGKGTTLQGTRLR
jgi:hypothetical protein